MSRRVLILLQKTFLTSCSPRLRICIEYSDACALCRVFSIVGVVGTTFTSMLMLSTSALDGPLPGVTRTGPPSFEKFWVGATNILFVFGGHAMCVEVSGGQPSANLSC